MAEAATTAVGVERVKAEAQWLEPKVYLTDLLVRLKLV